jgi:hypothetical protein
MEIRFRELNPFNCWIWMRFGAPLGPAERGYVETLLDSWFFLGKLGGFNAENLQCHEEGVELGWMGYDLEAAERALPALMHNMGVMEYREDWARCWLDLGTSDAFSLDVLINSLGQLNRDVVEIEELLIGGENDDWPVEQHPDSLTDLLSTEIGGIEFLGLGHQPVHRAQASHPTGIGHRASQCLARGGTPRPRHQKQGRLGWQTLHQQCRNAARQNGPRPGASSLPRRGPGLIQQPFD